LKAWIGRTVPRAHPAENAELRPIYAAHGSFLILSRRFFDAGGISMKTFSCMARRYRSPGFAVHLACQWFTTLPYSCNTTSM
jgi:hypothetical protein